jgi:DNA-binding NarL/FixJ family response regulator
MAPYRVIVADDHTLMRDGIRNIIESQDDLSVVGEAADGLQLLKLLQKTVPDLIVLDIAMPGLRGIEAAQEIKAHHPRVAILFLSMHKNQEYLENAIATGAEGYLLKENTGQELLTAIETIRKGKTYLSPLFAEEFPLDLIGICRRNKHTPPDPLTRREREVLKLVAEGYTNRQISGLLYISVRTVQSHRMSIRKKLNCKRTADLVKYAIQKGFIQKPG